MDFLYYGYSHTVHAGNVFILQLIFNKWISVQKRRSTGSDLISVYTNLTENVEDCSCTPLYACAYWEKWKVHFLTNAEKTKTTTDV